jgi:hypothetical protein
MGQRDIWQFVRKTSEMNLLHLLLWRGSRKVSFGIYLFVVANVYLYIKLISSEQWFTCVCLTTALIGGGTVADKFLEAKKQPPQV